MTGCSHAAGDVRQTGGTWDSTRRNTYFIASGVGRLIEGAKVHDELLIAVSDIGGEEDILAIERWIDQGKHVFIDSGVFSLASEHARAHNLSHDQALALAPDEIDGFDELFGKYTTLLSRLGDRCWGYVEIDQGGRENKIRTRAKLESLGFSPIPVYHPFSDGWDYFDELAGRYDRICFGNVVQAERSVRMRLLATAVERSRKYPDLWIHMLGLTPNEWAHAYPVASGDSSSWLTMIRWTASARMQVCLQSFTRLAPNFAYSFGTDADSETGHKKAAQLGAYEAHFRQLCWQALRREYEAA